MADLADELEELEEDDLGEYEDLDEELVALADITSRVGSISHPDIEGFDLAFEAPPATPIKTPRPTKVVLAWEEFLSFVIETPGRWIRVFEFGGEEAKAKARARGRSMRTRLIKTQPGEEWEILVAEDRDSDGKLTGVWKVYAQYVGKASAELVADRQAKAVAATERGKRAAAARETSRKKVAAKIAAA